MLLLAVSLALGSFRPSAAADWQRWTLAATSDRAAAAVFSRAPQRLAVRSGERIGDSPWVLVAIDGDKVWLRAAETQSQRELLRTLRRGEALPALPEARDLGLEAIEVPVIQAISKDGGDP